jgi:hypothetical protein
MVLVLVAVPIVVAMWGVLARAAAGNATTPALITIAVANTMNAREVRRTRPAFRDSKLLRPKLS